MFPVNQSKISKKLNKLFEYILSRNKLLAPIIIFNLIGSYYGYFIFYKDQILSNPQILWPFIPDSPTATLLTAISILLYTQNKNNNLINLLAIFANIKYGLWTAIIMLSYPQGFLNMNPLPMNIFIFFSHLGMAIQAIMIYKYTKIQKTHLTIAASYFLANDTIDYLYGVYPGLPVEQTFLGYSHIIETILTISITAYIIKEKFMG